MEQVQHEAGLSIEETHPDDVFEQKGQNGPEQKIHPARLENADPLLRHHVNGERGIPVYRREVRSEIRIGIMLYCSARSAHSPFHANRFMYGPFLKSSPASPKEPEVIIRVPAAVFYPLPEKECLSGDPIAVGRSVRRDDPPDLLSELRLDRLICIQAQDPLSRRSFDGEILLAPVAKPVLVEDLASIFPADCHGIVRAAGINHDDLIRPRDALEGPPDVCFFVMRDDGD